MKLATLDTDPTPIAPAIGQAVAHLRAVGIEPGDRVLVCDENSPELVIALLALVQIDCSIVLADDSVDQSSLHHMVDVAAPKAVLARSTASLAPITTSPPSSWALFSTSPEPPAAVAEKASGWDASLPWIQREDALVLFTSGSSGQAKGVVRSGRAMMSNIEATHKVMGYRPDDVLLSLVPVTHQYGFSIALLAWLTSCTLALGHPSRPVESLRAMTQRCDVTVVDGAPSHYEALLTARTEDPSAGAQVRMWCVGGAPCSASLRNRFAEMFGEPLLDGYGMTELGNIALGTSDSPEGVGLPIPGVEVKVMDTTSPERECTPGRPGRLLVRSRHAFHRYLHEESPQPRDDWFDTEDLGWKAEDGTLHVVGRLGAVHRHGHTLHLAGLEAQLREHGLNAVLIAIDADETGETPQTDARLLAYVEGTDQRALKREVRDSLPRFAWPNSITVLERFPLLPNGKVDRTALTPTES